jgi:hypothetical protein
VYGLVDVSIPSPLVKPHQLSVTLTEAFVATCSPDELLGQVIQTLCPRYNIDAPHLLALRQLLSSTIVAPRKPPTLKRTRPDKRIGEIGSIYDTPRRSPYGPNGPPVSANQSFYFHHQDVEFERLLPRVDRTCYVWRNEPASQSDSDGEEIPDSQESMQSQVSTIETPATARNVSTLLTTFVTTASTNSDEKTTAKAHPQAKETRSTATQGLTSRDEQLSVPKSSPKTPRRDASASSPKSRRPSVPTITITTPRSTERMVTSEHEQVTLPSPPLPAASVAMELLDSQETHSVPPPPYSASSFYMPQCSNTQDTVNSTQLSEVFSPPDDFMNYTPPTQEETQPEALSQAETSSSDPSLTAIKMGANASAPPPRHSPRALPSNLLVSSPLLGKRSRGKSEVTDDAPSFKRSKCEEGA